VTGARLGCPAIRDRSSREVSVKILVFVKQVVATDARVRVAADGRSVDTSGVELVLNPFDEYALEEALRIKEKRGGEVIAATLGPDKSAEVLRTALALGADRAVHVKDPSAMGGDIYATANVLAAIAKSVGPDLIFVGKQAVDDDGAAVGLAMAGILGWPSVGVAVSFELSDDGKSAVVHREIEGAHEIVETPLPAVITAQKGLNEPRYATLKGIMTAKKKPIEEATVASLGLDTSSAGEAGSGWRIVQLAPPAERGQGKKLEGDPVEIARELVRLLHEEAKVI
jgi:electron transfer flavoprotein beta subunit